MPSLGQAMQQRMDIARQRARTDSFNADTARMATLMPRPTMPQPDGLPAASANFRKYVDMGNAMQQARVPQPSVPTMQQSIQTPVDLGPSLGMSFQDTINKPFGFRKGIARVTDPNGSPIVDTVDAKLADGEAVLNAGAAEILGRDKIASLNKRGLKNMGIKDAKPMVKDGKVHAYAGIDFGSDEMRRRGASNEFRRLAQSVKPAPGTSLATIPGQTATISRPAMPIYDVREVEMMDPERVRADVRGLKGSYAKQIADVPRQQPITAKAGLGKRIAGAEKVIPRAGSGLLRMVASAPALGIMSMLESGNAGNAADDAEFLPGGRFNPIKQDAIDVPQRAAPVVTPQPSLRSAVATPTREQQAASLDALSKQYLNTPHGQRSVALSNADFAARGMGDIVKQVGKDGRTTYTNVGATNPYMNEEAQARSAAFKEGERRAASLASMMATTPEQAAVRKTMAEQAMLDEVVGLRRLAMAETNPEKRAEILANINIMTGAQPAEQKRRNIVSTMRKSYADGQVMGESPLLYDPEAGRWIEPPAQSGAVNSPVLTKAEVDAISKKYGKSYTDKWLQENNITVRN